MAYQNPRDVYFGLSPLHMKSYHDDVFTFLVGGHYWEGRMIQNILPYKTQRTQWFLFVAQVGWLASKDPYNDLLKSIYSWLVVHPLGM